MDHLLLEEISDERAISSAKETGLVAALSSLRTRRGLDRGIALGLFRDPRVVEQAFHQTEHPVTRALPFIQIEDTMLDSSVRKALAQAKPGSTRHVVLLEAVRGQYRRNAQALDKADKERVRARPMV
jgi:hypothetical protein